MQLQNRRNSIAQALINEAYHIAAILTRKFNTRTTSSHVLITAPWHTDWNIQPKSYLPIGAPLGLRFSLSHPNRFLQTVRNSIESPYPGIPQARNIHILKSPVLQKHLFYTEDHSTLAFIQGYTRSFIPA